MTLTKEEKVKVRVLVPNQCGTEGDARGLAEFDKARAQALVDAGFAEFVEPKVERATAAPGEKRDVAPRAKAAE